MSQPIGPTYPGPNPPTLPGPSVWPAAAPITVPDLACGHIPGDVHDDECAYWNGVAAGDYPTPDAYAVTGDLLDAISRPLVCPAPRVDPALGGAE